MVCRGHSISHSLSTSRFRQAWENAAGQSFGARRLLKMCYLNHGGGDNRWAVGRDFLGVVQPVHCTNWLGTAGPTRPPSPGPLCAYVWRKGREVGLPHPNFFRAVSLHTCDAQSCDTGFVRNIRTA